ncbi:major facilitator superfamily MFS 1 [Halovivax asiaticus JCM 14624]|uniref:Major facilitator superfamily MFS 1 n=1 Tax=Halovivax asiaticus JCM 14624 TaxID=1227490 RepID=M0BG25_9EURY|nr:MFS transporter [Halovivax asiaticus]ELZ08584.1 major facilitator superfamily MFS 1 [Halovivax asiaticus JCM 14624]
MGLSGNDRAIAGFAMTGHGLVHWFETSIPIFLVVWLAEFEVSTLLAGLVVALGYAPFGLGALPAGILADRFGAKTLVVTCLAGMSASFVILGLSGSLVGVAIGLVCWGAAASIYHPAGLSLISTGVEQRGRVFAWHGMAGNAGIALGPFVAATLMFLGLTWQTTALILAIPGALAAVYGLRADFDPTAAVDPDVDAGADEALSLADFVGNSRVLFASAFALVFVIVTFEGLFYRGMLTFLPEILHGSSVLAGVAPGPSLEGFEPGHYIYVGLLVVGIAGQYVGGRLTDRIRPATGLLAFFAVLAILALSFVPILSIEAGGTAGLVAVVGLSALFGFFLFAIQPFYQEAVAVYTPPDSRGLSYGYTYLGEFGFGAASIAIGGYVLDVSTPTFLVTMATFAVIGVALSVGLSVGVGRFLGTDSEPGATTADE